MPLSNERLAEIVQALTANTSGAKHETVRTLVYELVTAGLGFPIADVDNEKREYVGRIDALLGRTVFEFKSSLRREQADVDRMLRLYLRACQERTGQRYVGIATDGAEFVAYEEVDGSLVRLGACKPSRENPREILQWLEGVVAVQDDVLPEPERIRQTLGRESVAYGAARQDLARMWQEVGAKPDVALKRELWSTQLSRVYGSDVDSDELFFQHTYLTIVAKTMATAVLGVQLPTDGAELLDGKPLTDAGIYGAVEADFFNWLLDAPDGAALVLRIAAYVKRFRLKAVQSDVLKTLYESLIDPEQRHDLGEYYTPDWLAQMICDEAITDPLAQRVLDPSCGSGTFLFHAVRKFTAAAEAAGYDNKRALAECCDHVFGIDVHPVASIIARVTYLLALGELLAARKTRIDLPVYLGDSLQWNTRTMIVYGELLLGPDGGETLHFPAAVATKPAAFDRVVAEMLAQSENHASETAFKAWLTREMTCTEDEAKTLSSTYSTLKGLYDQGRDHVWGYVARNLSRPVWLSSDTQRAHVIVGNPPWLSYRFMNSAMQARFKEECQQRGLWAGGNVATHQDLSGYFMARVAELYLQADGLIALVMPYAALNRKQFEGLRSGWWAVKSGKRRKTSFLTEARFEAAWTFDEHVQPLFPVPSCVLFARKKSRGPLPATVRRARGTLLRRDAHLLDAIRELSWATAQWPAAPLMEGGSVYRESFREGATMVPRKLAVVEPDASSGLGGDAAIPVFRSRSITQEKEPWKSLSPLRAPIESDYVRPLFLGESILPFRAMQPPLAVVAWDGRAVMDSSAAQAAGLPRLASWLATAERLWDEHGTGRMSLSDRWDYHRGIANQFPIAPIRVLYAASGTIPAACVLANSPAVIEHKLYWASMSTLEEASYLVGILNSETARVRIAGMQSRGQWGARDFDKVMFELPIPKFDGTDPIHQELSQRAAEAEIVAAAVDVSRVGFVAARGRIRDALRENGVAAKIEALVEQLLS